MTVIMQEFIWNNSTKRDEAMPIVVDYNPQTYATKEAAARGLYNALVQLATSMGQDASEVMLCDPAMSRRLGSGDNWRVIWESGPYEWAIGLSFQVTGPWGYTEPYYSFDLCFTE